MQEQDLQNKKFVTLGFVAAGLLAFIVIRVLFQSAAISFGSVGRFWANPLLQHGIPVAFGLVTFFVLQFNSKIAVWGEEVIVEIGKIVWPSRKDTVGMTIVACVMLLIAGVFFGLFDILATSAVQYFVK
jgi:preprotein translocase subunit SecE